MKDMGSLFWTGPGNHYIIGCTFAFALIFSSFLTVLSFQSGFSNFSCSIHWDLKEHCHRSILSSIIVISQQAPQMEVASKRSIDGEPHVTTNTFLAEKQVEKVASKRSIDGEPHVTTNMFLAEKQVERVVKKQKVETIEGKLHVTTYPILAEKQEVENAEKPHSKNKNEEIAKPEVEVAKVESSDSDSDSDSCSSEPIEPGTIRLWSPCTAFEEDYPDETKYYESWGNLKVSAKSKIGSESDSDSDSDDDTSSEDE
ncbi:hypothetical protein P8452_42808 [Trifolium repens]|nr:hypothetical protein P8452_42808 [Trifolium repens]